jgi:hypothetical protein
VAKLVHQNAAQQSFEPACHSRIGGKHDQIRPLPGVAVANPEDRNALLVLEGLFDLPSKRHPEPVDGRAVDAEQQVKRNLQVAAFGAPELKSHLPGEFFDPKVF